MTLPGWDSLDAVKNIHSVFELGSLGLLAAVVIFDVLAHLPTKHSPLFKVLGLFGFGLAVLSEICAYPYSGRNDELAKIEIVSAQRMAAEAYRDAQQATAIAKGFEEQIAAANARAKGFEAQVASSTAQAAKALKGADFLAVDLSAAKSRALEAEQKLSGLDEMVKELSRDADALSTDLARTKERAVDATARVNQLVEEERSLKASIDAKAAERALTDGQVATIATVLKDFSGQEFEVVAYSTNEPLAIATRIYQALDRARWRYLKPEKPTISENATGVQVYIHPKAGKKTKKAAAALVSLLTNEGIASMLTEQSDLKNPKNRLYVTVGVKE
jgi:hypothetical protein